MFVNFVYTQNCNIINCKLNIFAKEKEKLKQANQIGNNIILKFEGFLKN